MDDFTLCIFQSLYFLFVCCIFCFYDHSSAFFMKSAIHQNFSIEDLRLRDLEWVSSIHWIGIYIEHIFDIFERKGKIKRKEYWKPFPISNVMFEKVTEQLTKDKKEEELSISDSWEKEKIWKCAGVKMWQSLFVVVQVKKVKIEICWEREGEHMNYQSCLRSKS